MHCEQLDSDFRFIFIRTHKTMIIKKYKQREVKIHIFVTAGD